MEGEWTSMNVATFQTRLREQGQLTLPAGVRKALGISPGDELHFEVTERGVVEVHGPGKIHSDLTWFWTEERDASERREIEDVGPRHTTVHESADDVFDFLEDDRP
ncbi:AbrB/MazE/SpoVT family DNA-binding domain-containing protein [Streptomyces sp. NPDC005529]|uniref:AbrB/MazE/SpoVT family DNA-binding domain-containing protein n=1 Tax=unclassified Streptomyces TaxID=2593676 RepID=UPI0033B94866